MTLLILASLALAACGALVPPTPTNPGTIQTAAAQTVSAALTQVAFETLVARVTEISKPTQEPGAPTFTALPPTAQPSPTNTPPPPTPTFTSTPLPTHTAVPPTPTKTPIPIPCNLISRVDDRSYPDGTQVAPGETFTKTWRLWNGGTCTWTDGYKLTFVSGDAMSSPANVSLNASVAPNQYIDVSVKLVAPNETGTYTGYFMLKNTNGGRFGWGANSSEVFWVQVKVVNEKPKDPNTVYDFSAHYCDATWVNSNGEIACPSTAIDFTNGSITRQYNPVLEGGRKENEPALITVPDHHSDGKMSGKFPGITIKAGYHFKAVVGCLDGAPKCKVQFELNYVVGTADPVTLGDWTQTSDGKIQSIDIDLASLVGKKVIFYLRVDNLTDSTDDLAFWLSPRLSK